MEISRDHPAHQWSQFFYYHPSGEENKGTMRLVKLAQGHTASGWPSQPLKSASDEQHLENAGSSDSLPCQLSAPLSDCPWAHGSEKEEEEKAEV